MLCEGEEQAQPVEIADCDDDWFKLMGRGRETVWQRLARMVAEGIGIDNTGGIESTDWVEPEILPGSIAPFRGDREKGAMEAQRHTNGNGELCFSTDGLRIYSGRTVTRVVRFYLDLQT